MNILNSKYFFRGSAKLLRHGDDEKLLQYALYNPIIDRFVIAHSNVNNLKLISMLFSSRYNLILCRLDRAINFEENLIDNEVVTSWTGNVENISFTRFPEYSSSIFELDNLIHTDTVEFDDATYLLAAATWIELLLANRFNTDAIDLFEDFYYDLLPFKNPKKKLTKEIYNIIYKEFDFTKAEKQINNLLENYESKDLSKLNLCIDRLCD